jgi:hypothetical protein
MAKRKATKILEALTQPTESPVQPATLEEPPLEKPVENIETIVMETPAVEKPLLMPVEVATKKRKEKDPLVEEMKKMRKFQEDQTKQLENRLEGLIARKFMEIKNSSKPTYNYKPPSKPPIQRVRVKEYESEDDYGGYATQEDEYVPPAPANYGDRRSELYSKIFG